MMTRNLLLSVTNYMEKPNFRVNIPFKLPCDSYFGFNKDQAILCSIIGKAQSLVDPDRIVDKWIRRTFDYEKKLVRASIPYLLGISLLLLVVMALSFRLYTTRVREARRQGETDHLTSLSNRRCFDRLYLLEWERAIKERNWISVLAFDVDHFKKFNDTYGHPNGDLALKSVADEMRKIIHRNGDLVARVGGEEFAAVLRNTDVEGAIQVAEKLRKDIADTKITLLDGSHSQVTVSIGVAGMKPKPHNDMHTLIHVADEALYHAKATGRNRVCRSNVKEATGEQATVDDHQPHPADIVD